MTTPPRFLPSGGHAASLALLRARLGRLPGVDVLDDGASLRRLPARLVLDVGGTGLSGFELGRRMRAFSDVPLDFCRERRLVVVFEDAEEITTRGERLLFALAHACQSRAAAVCSEV